MDDKTALIWLVIGDKPGDNAQIEILAETLGLPYEIKRVIPKSEYILGKPKYKISLSHLDLEKSAKLEAPWPDMILTIGRRPSMAALWIQEQSDKPCKIVLLGRPKRWFDRFSLIITPPQYQMPDDPKIIKLSLPLMRINKEAITLAIKQWSPQLSQLPKPLTAVMIGGPTKPYRLDNDAISNLLGGIQKHYSQGSLYFTSSRRTPEAVNQYIRTHLPKNAQFFCWDSNNAGNPYHGLMALADRFIVTGDSVSMMVEVARLGKPLVIYELPFAANITAMMRSLIAKSGSTYSEISLLTKLQRSGLLGYSRDLTAIHKVLYNQQLASPFKTPFNISNSDIDDGIQKAISAIQDLFI